MNDPPGVRFLDDVRVLEVASLAPAQLGMHLADLGAEVIKIEPPKRGDATRLIGRRAGFSDSGIHRRWNRGKKSVALDTTTPEGVDILCRLIPNVDILIEGLRPGTLEKMGLGWSELTALKRNLVMVALSGYGQSGPYRDMPSHGIGFDAIAGLAAIDEDDLGRPRIRSGHVYYGPVLAPLFGVGSALAALSWSRRTGRPVLLDIAQADAAAFANYAVEEQATDRSAAAVGLASAPPVPEVGGAPSAPRSSMESYRTRDDRVLMLMALERKFFVRLAEVVGRPDLLDHVPEDQYIVQGSREVDDALVDIISSKDLDDWMRIFAEADVPVVPVYESAQVLDDPHLATRIEWLDADEGAVTMKSPVQSEPSTSPPVRAPAIGQDTAEVLAAIGIDPPELDRLVRAGIVRVAPDEAAPEH